MLTRHFDTKLEEVQLRNKKKINSQSQFIWPIEQEASLIIIPLMLDSYPGVEYDYFELPARAVKLIPGT